MSANNQNQPGLVAGHAQYVKGAAEVSIHSFKLLLFYQYSTCSNVIYPLLLGY